MRRRDLITILGGTAVTWPLAARAQQAERVRRLGVLMSNSEDDQLAQARVSAIPASPCGAGLDRGAEPEDRLALERRRYRARA
jgi:hypothetical protein